MIDHDVIARANERHNTHPRSLRRVGEILDRDMVTFEDRATGERRHVANKTILMFGAPVAFELANVDDLFDEES